MTTRRLLLLCLLAISCKSVEVKGDAPPPTLPTQELQVTQSLTEFKLKYTATIASTESVTIESANYEVVVDGKVTATKQSKVNLTIAAGTSVPFTLEETTKYVASSEELAALDTKGGSLLAAIRGTLTVIAPNTKPQTVEFARSREVRVPRLPHMKFQEFEAGRYSEDEAGVTFHVGVYNPNPFDVQLTSITYKVQIAGKPVGDGVIGKGERVNPSSTGVFDIEAKVTADSHGGPAEVKKLIKTRVMPYVISGTLKSDLFEEPFEFKGDIRLNASK